jgi:alpha-L-rhamnosidase
MLLGDLIVWYYENIGGIKAIEPGFKKIEMKPSLIEGLDYATVSYHSIHGKIKSDWKKDKGNFTWNITIPGNTRAVVYIPSSNINDIIENGAKANTAVGVKFLKIERNKAVFEIGSGAYSFVSKISNN